MATLVALIAAGTCQRLLHARAREHAKRARYAGIQLHAHHAVGRLTADEIVVVGLAANDRPQARDSGEAPARGGVASCERKLERTGHIEDLHQRVARVAECTASSAY